MTKRAAYFLLFLTTIFFSISRSTHINQETRKYEILDSEIMIQSAPDRIFVKYKAQQDSSIQSAIKATIESTYGINEVKYYEFIDVYLYKIYWDKKTLLEYLNQNPNVEYAEPDYIRHIYQTFPNDSSFDDLWGMHNTGQTGGTADADIDAPEAWDLTTGSADVIVGVIDTGVDYTHQDLSANMWTNPGEIPSNGFDDDGNGIIDDVYGLKALNGSVSGDPMDDHGHGTHCSGTVAGKGNDEIGVAGVCWTAKIMALKFLDSGGYGYDSDAITCIEYTIDKGAHVLSNSWGGGGLNESLRSAIEAAKNSGILFVAAAGNSSANNDTNPEYPGSYDNENIIAVAATDHNDNLASFSSYGATTVDVAAPGVGIKSCTPNNSYDTWDGTSMATPHVAGLAALIRSYDSSFDWQEIKSRILNGVDTKTSLTGKVLSGGRINAYGSLLLPSGAFRLSVQSFPASGLDVTVSPSDYNGDGNGTTDFSRVYTSDSVVTLTAPSTFDGMDFLKWTLDGAEVSADIEEKGVTQARDIQVTMDGNHAVIAHYGMDICQAVDNCDVTWEMGGEGGGWYGQTSTYFYDNDAAQSQAISDNQSNYLQTTVQGPGTVLFYWKVSSETNYDYLSFYIDSTNKANISGEVNWQQKSFNIESGTHTLKWLYEKDNSVRRGSDCGWLDNVEKTSITHTVSGTVSVTSVSGTWNIQTGLSGVNMSGLPGNPQTDASGNYSAPVNHGWTGTVTPTKSGYTFSPSNRSYNNVTSDKAGENYDASMANPVISGTVSASGGGGIAGVTITFSNGGGTTMTVENGSYSHALSFGWSGSAIPSKDGYTFSPSSRNYTNVTSGTTGQDYTCSLQTFTVAGTIRMSVLDGLSGVVMSGLPGNPTTDAAGNYSATVDYGWSGTATPTKTGYMFVPSIRSYSNVTSSQVDQDYDTSVIQLTIIGKIVDFAGVGLQGAIIAFSNGGGTATTDSDGIYSKTVSYGWSGSATPSKTGHQFFPKHRDYSNMVSNQTNENYTSDTCIQNPSMEDEGDSPKDWWTYNNELTRDSGWVEGVVHSGVRSIKIINTTGTDAAWRGQTVNFSEPYPHSLVLGGWVKTENVASGGLFALDFYIEFEDGSHEWYLEGLRFRSGTYDWENREKVATFAKGIKRIRPYCLLYSTTGTVWFDDIYALGNVIIQNPSMEEGGASPENWWTYNNDLTTESGWVEGEAHGGTRSIKIVNTTGNDAGWRGQTVTFNEPYPHSLVLGGWAKTENVAVGGLFTIDFYIEFEDGSHLWYADGLRFSPGTYDWENRESIATFSKGIKQIRPYCFVYSTTGEVWFDDIYALNRQAKPIISGTVSMNEISGMMEIQEGLTGVVMNGLPGSPETDTYGNYRAAVDYGWSGTVSPSKAGYTFTPLSLYYSGVTSDRVAQDYRAYQIDDPYEPNNTRNTAYPINLADSLIWRTEAGAKIDPSTDQDWFKFTASSGDQLTITCDVTSSLDAEVVLYLGDTLVASRDIGGSAGNETLIYTCSSFGTYYVGIGYYSNISSKVMRVLANTGSYQLTVQKGASDPYESNDTRANAYQISLSGTPATWQSGSGPVISPSTDQDWFKFSASNGDELTITCDVTSSLDAEIVLYLGDTLVASRDIGGSAGNETLTYNCTSADTYYVGIGFYSNISSKVMRVLANTGSYQLTVQKGAPSHLCKRS